MWTIKDFEIISKKNEGKLILNCGISDINININEKNMPNNAMFLDNNRFSKKSQYLCEEYILRICQRIKG